MNEGGLLRSLVPGAGLEPAHLAAGDFESPASTDFATRASVCSCAEGGRLEGSAECTSGADYGMRAAADSVSTHNDGPLFNAPPCLPTRRSKT